MSVPYTLDPVWRVLSRLTGLVVPASSFRGVVLNGGGETASFLFFVPFYFSLSLSVCTDMKEVQHFKTVFGGKLTS